MAVYEVFAHPELRRYKTHICTKASLLTFCILFLVFIPPLFVVYRSYGEWFLQQHSKWIVLIWLNWTCMNMMFLTLISLTTVILHYSVSNLIEYTINIKNKKSIWVYRLIYIQIPVRYGIHNYNLHLYFDEFQKKQMFLQSFKVMSRSIMY